MFKRILPTLCLLAVFFVLSFSIHAAASASGVLQTPLPGATIVPAATILPAAAPLPSATPLPPQPGATYEQLMGVQTAVLETTRSAMDMVTKIITILSVMIGVIVSVTALLGYNAYNRISDAAKQAEATKIYVDKLEASVQLLSKQTADAIHQANHAKAVASQSEQNIATISQQYAAALADIELLKKQTDEARQDLQKTTQELHISKTGMKADIDALRITLLMVKIEEYEFELYSDLPNQPKLAISALQALFLPDRPAFIRRQVVTVLGKYAIEYKDEEIVRWLEDVAKNDKLSNVRKTAAYELKKYRDSDGEPHHKKKS